MSDNRISGDLDDLLKDIQDMRSINLSHNGITSVGTTITTMGDTLSLIDLSFNNISELPSEFGKLTNLKNLNLAFNRIETFPESLFNIKGLSDLNLSYNKLSSPLKGKFGNFETLSLLNLAGNQLNEFPSVICDAKSLTKLYLNNNFIGGSIPGDVEKLHNLSVIDLSVNYITDIENLCKVSTLADINVSNNRIDKFVQGYRSWTHLIDFDISRNQLREVSWDLDFFHNLRVFSFSHNDIQHQRSKTLPFLVPGYSSILSSNPNPTIPNFQKSSNVSSPEDTKSPKVVYKYEGNNTLDRFLIDQTSKQQPVPSLLFNLRIGWSEMCGRRPDMQDSLCVHQYFQHVPWQHLVGVFDGHSGTNTALYCASNIASVFASYLRSSPAEAALRQTFHTLDKEVDLHNFSDGCTAVVCYIAGNTLMCANTGDSRAVLCSNGKAIDLSEDDKPDKPSEVARIQRLGGFISGTGRVVGELAVARSIGDCSLHPFVTCEPTIVKRELEKDDEFIIMACDGIWDVLSSQNAVDIVRSVNDPARAAALLRDCAYARGSADNLSALVIKFITNN